MRIWGVIAAAAILGRPVPSGAVDFATQVHPVLASRCAPCHSGAKPAGGLSLTTRAQALAGGTNGPAIVPGQAEQSLLILKVTGAKGAIMPASGDPLTTAQIAALRSWIEEGAVWPEAAPVTASGWVAPIAPRRPAVPEGHDENPLDRFVSAYFARHHVARAEPVSDALFARRAYFDLWGVPPSPDQLSAFIRDDRPDKRVRLVDALLANSTLYAGHWISWWNDLLRNDIGVNYQGERESITDWLLRALERNLSYDRMIAELVNPVGKDAPQGFLIGVNWRGDVNASQTPYMQAAQNTAQVFLGINLKCASCHDSFINRYKLRESYGMAALFSPQSRLELVRCDVKTGKYTAPQLLYPELGSVSEEASLADRHAAAAAFFTDKRNGRVPRTIVNRYWQKLFGRGLVEPVDDMDAEPWNDDLLDWLASDFAEHGSDLRHLLRLIMTSRTYQLPAVVSREMAEKPYVFRGPQVRRLSAEQFADSVSAVTGEWRAVENEKSNEVSPARDWQFKASPLAAALGRPVRDQVFTTRDNRPTTFQALELANGSSLESMLRRGTLRLLGQLPAAPENLFDSGPVRKSSVAFDIELPGVKRLWLLQEDAGSYDPTRVQEGWAGVEFVGPGGPRTLASLAVPGFKKTRLVCDKEELPEVLTAPLGSRVVLSIDGSGFTRMRGKVLLDDRSRPGDINGAVRFFVFAAEPNPEQLVRVSGEPPFPAPARLNGVDDAIQRMFVALLAREPNPEEVRVARGFFGGGMTSPALQDFLWSMLLHPEFQYVY
ncbi:MAG: PSD1 and planctomycete cytochrome C domain-containing protein [Bryobacteraceae bacterium]